MQKSNASPYLELLIVLRFIRPWCKIMRLFLDLIVGHAKVHGFLVPWRTIVIVLLVRLCPLILANLLSNQKLNILTTVGHGHFPLVLKILLFGKLITVTFQIKKWQELQTVVIYFPPIVRICLETLVWFYNAIDNGLYMTNPDMDCINLEIATFKCGE